MDRPYRSLTLYSEASSTWSSYSSTKGLLKRQGSSLDEVASLQIHLRVHPACLPPAPCGPVCPENSQAVGPMTRKIARNPIGTFIAFNSSFLNGLRKMKETFSLRKVEFRRQARQSAALNIKEAAPLEQLWLEDLAPQILQHIATFLPSYSVAILALSSRVILSKLGTKCLEQIPKRRMPETSLQAVKKGCVGPAIFADQQERESFLQLLDKDLIYEVYCYHCQIIHRSELSKYCGLATTAICYNVSPTSRVGRPTGLEEEHRLLNFAFIQLLMKRHRQGYDVGRHLRTLESFFNNTAYMKDVTEQRHAIAKIIEGQLYMRFQLFVWSKSMETTFSYPRYNVCLHCHTPSSKDGVMTATGNGECPRCFTDFRLSKDTFSNGQEVICLTIWKNLGEGRSPFEIKWLSHFFNTYAYFTDSYQSLKSERSSYQIIEGTSDRLTFMPEDTQHPRARRRLFKVSSFRDTAPTEVFNPQPTQPWQNWHTAGTLWNETIERSEQACFGIPKKLPLLYLLIKYGIESREDTDPRRVLEEELKFETEKKLCVAK